jgi:hypothetical protein
LRTDLKQLLNLAELPENKDRENGANDYRGKGEITNELDVALSGFGLGHQILNVGCHLISLV